MDAETRRLVLCLALAALYLGGVIYLALKGFFS
jgi:hypothetical protein